MSKYLKINNLSYTYPDGHKALKGIDFSINKGESIAILGPNGAGKTTLILHLNGILGELKGEIEVDGLEYSTENIGKIRKTVGVVFQDPDDQLFMPTVIEDVMFGPKNFGYSNEESETNAVEALKMVGMENFQDRAPHHLSFGQKRKVAIATVLASKPKLLVLDEPASNLDPASRRDLIAGKTSLKEIKDKSATARLALGSEDLYKSSLLKFLILVRSLKTTLGSFLRDHAVCP